MQILKMNSGIGVRRRTRIVFVDLQKKLRNLCQSFREGELYLEDFLARIGSIIRLG